MQVCAHIVLVCSVVIVQAAGVELVAYATDSEHEGVRLLQNTARWHGWSALHIIGTPEGYETHGLVDKVRALRRFARDWPDDTVLVFVDGYDVVVNNEPSKLEAAFLASGKRVMFASEMGCCTSKQTALEGKLSCHSEWPFPSSSAHGRAWLNSGVMVGYAKDIRELLRMAWREYKTAPELYQTYTDQNLMCFLLAEGGSIWVRAAVGIDHMSELALTTFNMDIRIGQVLGLDTMGRIVFANRSVPAMIHFNGHARHKTAQIAYAKANFPLLQAVGGEHPRRV
jgi:hypothetical protein